MRPPGTRFYHRHSGPDTLGTRSIRDRSSGMSTKHRLTVEELRTQVRGEVVTPSDPAYDQARRVWNAMIDKRPAAIVRPRSAVDVIASVNFARDAGLPLAIRGGAHNVAGKATCDD